MRLSISAPCVIDSARATNTGFVVSTPLSGGHPWREPRIRNLACGLADGRGEMFAFLVRATEIMPNPARTFSAATKIVSANAKKRPLNAYFVTQKEVSLTRRYSSFDVSFMTIKLFAWTKYWILGPERILNELYEVLLYLRSLPRRGALRKGLRTRPRRCHDANSLR